MTTGHVAPISELRELRELRGEEAGRLLMQPCLQWQAPKRHLIACVSIETRVRGQYVQVMH